MHESHLTAPCDDTPHHTTPHHTKAALLLQAHFTHAPLPISDYVNDTKSVLDQSLRILNAMVDIAADEGVCAAA